MIVRWEYRVTESPVDLLHSASAAQAGRCVGRRVKMQETAADVKTLNSCYEGHCCQKELNSANSAMTCL